MFIFVFNEDNTTHCHNYYHQKGIEGSNAQLLSLCPTTSNKFNEEQPIAVG